KNVFFTRLQISLFNLIGQLIIISSVAETLLDFLANLILVNELKVELNFGNSYDSFFFKLEIGLFFISLAKVFDKDKKQREESELTDVAMPIIVYLDQILAKREMTSTALAENIGITNANLSIRKTGKAKAVRFSTLVAIREVL